jgi:hypothetical protein
VYKDFKIADFINDNTDLIKKRDIFYRELDEIHAKKKEVENENANYIRDLNNFSFTINTQADELGLNKATLSKKLNEKTKNKLKQYYDKCKNQVRILELRNNLLKNYFNQMSSSLKYFNVKECKHISF